MRELPGGDILLNIDEVAEILYPEHETLPREGTVSRELSRNGVRAVHGYLAADIEALAKRRTTLGPRRKRNAKRRKA